MSHTTRMWNSKVTTWFYRAAVWALTDIGAVSACCVKQRLYIKDGLKTKPTENLHYFHGQRRATRKKKRSFIISQCNKKLLCERTWSLDGSLDTLTGVQIHPAASLFLLGLSTRVTELHLPAEFALMVPFKAFNGLSETSCFILMLEKKEY